MWEIASVAPLFHAFSFVSLLYEEYWMSYSSVFLPPSIHHSFTELGPASSALSNCGRTGSMTTEMVSALNSP